MASIELGRVGPEKAYELGRRTDRPDADAIVMPGGNWPSMSVVERLERELGKPVLANNAVSLWAGLRLLKSGRQHPRLRPAAHATIWRMNWRKRGRSELDENRHSG